MKYRFMKKILLTAIAILMMSSCQESLEERAAREAREITESKCPMPVGDVLFLDSIVFDIPSLTQTQYFRFIDIADNDSTVEQMKHNDLKKILTDELKNTPNYKSLMQRGVSFRYIYRSTQEPSKIYLDITLNKEDYQ